MVTVCKIIYWAINRIASRPSRCL
uniref:Uncharacterized protein n=1 Tax=Anguilla anguilla TaxID=7936 RepID=A0A0E9SR96_ANGAN